MFCATILTIQACCVFVPLQSVGLLIISAYPIHWIAVYGTFVLTIYGVLASHFITQFLVFIPMLQTINFWLRKCRFGIQKIFIYIRIAQLILKSFSSEWVQKSADLSIATLTDSIVVYQRIRLLNDLHNDAFGSLFVLATKMGAVFALYISVAAITFLRSAVAPILLGAFFLYMSTILLVIFPGALMMSQVYIISSSFNLKVERCLISIHNCAQEKHQLKRTLKSLPVMKSKVGNLYHMESKAKLTLLDNIARGIAFMLITSK